VFAEAPDPYALTDISDTAVLLPAECGRPVDALAGLADVSELTACLEGRPTWSPASSAGLTPPRSAGWLPVPPALVQLRGDARRGAPPPPLRLPLSTLSMDAAPGSATAFQTEAAVSFGATGADSWQRSPRPRGGEAPGRAAAAAAAEKASGDALWSFEECEQAHDALLALQGVHSALMRVQGLLAAPEALPRPAAAGILSRVAAAAALRQQLQRFVDHHTTQAASSAAADPALAAFAAAAGRVLRRQAAELAAIERRCAPAAAPAPGMSLLQVWLRTAGVRLALRTLAELCWCTAAAPGARARWEVAAPPRGAALLDVLHAKARAADGQEGDSTARFLFAAAAQPCLAQLRPWAFSLQPLPPGAAARAPPAAMRFEPPAVGADGAPRAGSKVLPLAVPAPLPAFLAGEQAALERAGAQLRLLHSVQHPAAHALIRELAAIAEVEQRCAVDDAGGAAGPWLQLPGGGAAGAAGGGGLDAGAGGVELLLEAGSLQAVVAAGRAADAARRAAVESWLAGLALERRAAEGAAQSQAASKADSLREQR
jgi:hypothetical protein